MKKGILFVALGWMFAIAVFGQTNNDTLGIDSLSHRFFNNATKRSR